MYSLNMVSGSTARTRAPQSMDCGFTFLELMMVSLIVAIMVAIALPSYSEKLYQGRRADGKTALADLANRMEAYYGQNNTYATATVAAGTSSDVLSSGTSVQGFYTLSIQASSATTYTIRAVPVGTQAGDTKCGTLTLTSANVKGISGTATVPACW